LESLEQNRKRGNGWKHLNKTEKGEMVGNTLAKQRKGK